MRKDLKKRLATEYRYAANKMQEVVLERKMFYYSVLFGEAQRVLNIEWDRDLALVYMVTQQSYNQINAQTPMFGIILPIKASTVYETLTKITSDIATYYEKAESEGNKNELYQILGRLAEISYATNGNGTYLYEKGVLIL
jgi:predicted metal-dependent hydrolase